MVVMKFDNGKTCSYNNKLFILLNGIKKSVEQFNNSAVILIDGKSGLGKSTLGIQIGHYFNEDKFHIHYDTDSMLKTLASDKETIKHSVHMLDEAMLLNSRSALSKLNKDMMIAMSMIRSKNIYVIFCINSVFDLDRNLVLSRANALLHVYSKGLTDKGKVCGFYKATEETIDRLKMLYLLGKKFYSYSKPKSNWNSTFTKEFLIDQEEYDKRKDEAVNEFLLNKDKKTFDKYREHTKLLIKWLRNVLKKRIMDISEESQLSKQTIHTMLNEE